MQTYGTVTGADEYALAIGNTAWGALTPEAKQAALVRGSMYVDGYIKRFIDPAGNCWWTFIGTKTGGWAQEREWPRQGIADLPDSTVPVQIEYAAYEAAMREAANPGSLSPDIDRTQLVKREKVDVLEVTYAISDDAGTANMIPVIPVIDSLLAPFLVRRCKNQLAIYAV